MRRRSLSIGFVLIVLFAAARSARAQELEARTYSNAPRGVNFLGVGYGYSTGNVLLDPSLPIEGAEAEVHAVFARYTRTFGVFGKAAKLKLLVPLSAGNWQGLVEGVPRERDTSGFGDTRVTFEVNFSGAPALRPAEFHSYRQKTIVGASIDALVPTGSYDDTKLINLGSNRFTLRAEVGVSRALGHWIFEAAGTFWYYTDNDDFLDGMTLSQDPFYAVKIAGIYSFRSGFWVGALVGRGRGARTSVDGVPGDTEQRNWRFGLTATYPIDARQGLGATVTSGKSQGAGTEFTQYAVAYQFAWGF